MEQASHQCTNNNKQKKPQKEKVLSRVIFKSRATFSTIRLFTTHDIH